MKYTFGFLLLFVAAIATAEQSVQYKDWTVHYSVFNSTFLKPEQAEKYGIVRSEPRAVIIITVLDPDETPSDILVTGQYKNLLGQEMILNFQTIKEGVSMYRYATFLFDDEETLRFEVDIEFAHGTEQLRFSQKLYHKI